MYPVNPLTPEVLSRHCGKMVCAVTKDGRRIFGRLKACNNTHVFVADERRNQQYRPCRAYKSSILETNSNTEITKKKKKRKKDAKIKGFYPYGGYGGYGYGGGWGAGWGWALGLTALALLFLI
ncbi:hypothetical protein QPK24_20205 [Paenibacillus polygoni]|uniref:Uncharacterized protein n=1 Tax=Paenibacillus polygoni TaxID=3050112 RepID=A0ABY8WZL4_9BACL|nr:hypothetical protein [Paenibacillus polygoni]WIV18660.1 hypothetical protein QPK24_20205 [Paenibacillus polygoni]